MWHGGSAPPDGFLECNGQSTIAYPKLAAVVGATVPDLRGNFVRGWAHDRIGTQDDGRSLGSYQADQLQGHGHRMYYYAKTRQAETEGNWYFNNGAGFSIFADNQVGGVVGDGINGTPRFGLETRPKNIALMAIIRHD